MSNLPVYQQAFMAYFMGRAMLSGATDPGDSGDSGDRGDRGDSGDSGDSGNSGNSPPPPTTSWETWHDVTDTVDQMFPPAKASRRQRIPMSFFRTMLWVLVYGMFVPATTAAPEMITQWIPTTEGALYRKVYQYHSDSHVDTLLGKAFRWTDPDLLGIHYCFPADEILYPPAPVGMALIKPQPNVCATFDRQSGSWSWDPDSDLAYTYKNSERIADIQYCDPRIVCYDEKNRHIEPMQSTRCSLYLDGHPDISDISEITDLVGAFIFLGVSCMVMEELFRNKLSGSRCCSSFKKACFK